MKNTLIVNLLGGSGVGKSTNSARLFAMLKENGIDCELVTEYAKDMVWEGRKGVFDYQPYLFGKQLYRIQRVLGKVDVIITDSPILLSVVYDKEGNENFKQYVIDKFNQFNNLNVYLTRVVPFNPNGRNEKNVEEAKVIDNKIVQVLNENNISYISVEGNQNGCKRIFDIIIEKFIVKNNIEGVN